jgi:hypothetical protein
MPVQKYSICPENDKLRLEAVWLGQNLLLSEKSYMDNTVLAFERIYKNADKILNVK